MNVLGLMSGSSLDGQDLALCNFAYIENKLTWELVAGKSFPFSGGLKNKLAEIHSASYHEALTIERDFTEETTKMVSQFLDLQNIDVQLLAWHGHTVFHYPERFINAQIGKAGLLCESVQIPVVADFRTQDIAQNGQGAPLAPICERDLFPGFDFYANLGGICNVTYQNKKGNIIAFDVCPCNQILNALSNTLGLEYDKNGAIAKGGKMVNSLYNTLANHSYYKKMPPKSLDNLFVQNEFVKPTVSARFPIEDKLFTVVKHIVFSIKKAAQQMQISTAHCKMLLSGGGAFNSFLVAMLADELQKINIEIVLPKAEIINLKEAILMAYMGFLRHFERANTIPSVTGASAACLAGAYYLPSSYGQ